MDVLRARGSTLRGKVDQGGLPASDDDGGTQIETETISIKK
jgi:hypothetical protein